MILSILMHLWISIVISLFQFSSSEKLTYNIYYKSNDIGDYSVVRTEVDGLVKYSSHSVTSIHIMGTVSVTVTQDVHFKDGLLVWSEAITKVNGHQHDHVTVKRMGHQYHVTSGTKTHYINDEIRYSIVKMMFEEPRHYGRVFSEIEGEFHRIEKKDTHSYTKTNSKGKQNHYVFDNQSMQHADLASGFYRFKMKRRP